MYPAEINKPFPRDESYDDTVVARAFWRASYTAGRGYRKAKDADGLPILIQHESEPAAHYRRRLKATPVRSYVGPIVRRYNDFVFRREPSLPAYDEASTYGMLVEDIDGHGTSAMDFWRDRLLSAQIDGVGYALIDSTRPPGSEPASIAAARAQGYRLVLAPIEANAVVWTQRDGPALTECAIAAEVDGQPAIRHYDANAYTDYFLDKAKQKIIAVGDTIAHGIAGLPIVELRPQYVDDSESQASPLADSQQSIFNLLSLLTEELYANTFTQWVLLGISADEAKDQGIEFGAKRLFCIPREGGDLKRIGSDVAQADSLRQSIAEEIQNLYRTSGVEASSSTEPTAPESGIARAFRFNDLAANLSAMADAVQSAWNTAMWRIHATLGQQSSYPGDADFPDDFAPPDFGAELRELIDTLAASAVPPVVKRAIADRFVGRNLSLSEEDANQWLVEREKLGQSPMAGLFSGADPARQILRGSTDES